MESRFFFYKVNRKNNIYIAINISRYTITGLKQLRLTNPSTNFLNRLLRTFI